MNCKTIHKNLIFFLEGDLPSEEMKAIEEHLKSCSECSLFAEDLKLTLGIIEKEKTPDLNPFFYTRVKARLEKSEEKLSPTPLFVSILQPVTFTLLLLVGVYAGFKLGDTSSNHNEIVLAEQDMIPYWNALDGEPIESFLIY